MATKTLTYPWVDDGVWEAEDTDGGSSVEEDDWYVLKGRPWQCDCGASKPYAAEKVLPHRLIVWPSRDDPNLKRIMREAALIDGEPAEIHAYERSMGESVSYYDLTPS